MPVVASTPENIDRAAAILRDGGVVAFPTETVYGLGAHAFDARAVARIFEIKRRPSFDPLIVHVVDDAMFARVAASIDDAARALMAAFWPGALTLVLAKQTAVPDIVTSGLATVAVRMPSHPVARALLRRAGVPLAAPSANPFGYLSPTCAEHVQAQLGDTVDLVLDGGACERGVESTIVMLEPRPTLLRHGAIALEEIERIVGTLARSVSDETTPLAPGRLSQHYSPHTPVRIIDPRSVPLEQRTRAAALMFAERIDGYAHQRILSARGDMREAAAQLFAALHELDRSGATRIDAEPISQVRLGAAIMDRLLRASSSNAGTNRE